MRDLLLPARPRLPPERRGRADDRGRGPAGDAARGADERLLRGRGARPDRGREPRPLAPHRRSTTAACAARRCTGREGAGCDPTAGSTSPRRGSPGRQLAWLSGVGDVPWNGDWGASWGGGLVTTCGLDNVGRGLGGDRACTARTPRFPPTTASIDDPRGLRVERAIETGRRPVAADRPHDERRRAPRSRRRCSTTSTSASGSRRSRPTRPRSCRGTRTRHRTTRRGCRRAARSPSACGSTSERRVPCVRGDGIEVEVRSSLPRMWQWIDPQPRRAQRRARELLGARPRARPRRGTAPDARARRDARDLARRSRQRRRDEARPADGGVPGSDPRRGRGVGGRERLRDARGRVLAVRRRRAAPLRRRHARRRRGVRPRRGARDARPARPRDLGARLLPEQPPPRRRAPRAGQRPPAQGDRRGRRRSASTSSARSSATTRTARCPRTSSASGRSGRRSSRTPASAACGSRSRTAR